MRAGGVTTMKRSNDAADHVSSSELLANYVVTRASVTTSATGLPPVSLRDEPPEPEPTMRPVLERRGERRITTVRRVTTSHPGSEREVKGVTNNISAGGM